MNCSTDEWAHKGVRCKSINWVKMRFTLEYKERVFVYIPNTVLDTGDETALVRDVIEKFLLDAAYLGYEKCQKEA